MKNYRVFLICLSILLLSWTAWLGFTWHLIPVYVCLLLIVLSITIFRNKKRSVLFTMLMLTLPALSLLLLQLFPFIDLPNPTGAYAVGVTYRTIDTNREEVFTENKDDKRSLYVKIWYPASAGVNYNTYIEGGAEAVPLLLWRGDIPSFPFSQLAKTGTNSFTNAAIAKGRFPLLTFSHGWGGWFGQNTALMEELASQGFIVASIGHSHQTALAASDEKTLVKFPKIVPNTDWEKEVDSTQYQLGYRLFVEKTETDKSVYDHFFSKNIINSGLANKNVVIWADDILSTIDFMMHESEQSESFFHQHIDNRKIGSLGMSFGGSASAEAALRDSRILGVINLDGDQYGTWINDTINTPVLFLERQLFPVNFSKFGPFFDRSKSNIHCLLFKKAEHFNFTDVNLFSPAFRWIGFLGDVDGNFMIKSMNTIVPDYFNAVFTNENFQVEKHIRPGEIEEAIY